MEPPQSLRFGTENLPSLQWKDFHEIFSEFGEIKKLYIDTKRPFGSVQYKNPQNIEIAKQQLKRDCKFDFTFDGDSPRADSVHIADNSTDMYRRQILDDPMEEVDTYISTGKYVDAYGRRLDTLESEDGDIYISLSELKASGFEVFKHGALPQPGNIAFNTQLLQQFEMHLRTKAMKFMNVHRIRYSDDEVNGVIDKLKNEFYTPGQASSRKSLPVGSRPSFNRNEQPQRYDRDRRPMQESWPNQNQSFGGPSNKFQHQQKQYYQNGDQGKRQSKSFQPPQNQRNASYRQEGSGSRQGHFSSGSSSNQPDAKLSDDWSNFENKKNEKSIPSLINLNLEKPTNQSTPQRPSSEAKLRPPHSKENEGALRRPTSVEPIESKPAIQLTENKSIVQPTENEFVVQPTENKPVVQPTENKSAVRPVENKSVVEPIENKSVVEEPPQKRSGREIVVAKACDQCILGCTELVDKTTFLAYCMPAAFATELALLDNITIDCESAPTYDAEVGDVVAVFEGSELVRGCVVEKLSGKYSCALIDYAKINVVDKVYKLPQKYHSVPEFSALCSTSAENVEKIMENSTAEFSVVIEKPFHLKITLSAGVEIEAVASKWEPRPGSKPAAVHEEETSTRPPSTPIFKPNDMVIIYSEMKGSLLVRTRECDSVLKDITKELTNYKGHKLTAPPKKGQMVVCPFNDGILYRAAVVEIADQSVTVDYIDYDNSETVPLKAVLAISKKLVEFPITILKIKLKGFTDKPFAPKVLNLLGQCAEKRDKFKIIPAGDGVYDLHFLKDNSSLSELLASADKPDPPASVAKPEPPASVAKPEPLASVAKPEPPASVAKPKPPKVDRSYVRLTDVPPCKFNIGSNAAMCLFSEDLDHGTVSFASASPEDLLVMMKDLNGKIMMQVNSEPHRPREFEVCLAEYEGDWYRASCIKIFDDDTFGLFYMDFGNTSTVKAKDIRKISPELAAIECFSVLCTLEGVTNCDGMVEEPLLTELQKYIVENESYIIDVKKEDTQSYVITIPAIYETLKQKGLLKCC